MALRNPALPLRGMVWWMVPLLLLAQEDPAAEGQKALEAKNYPAAITYLKSAVEKTPDDIASRFNLAFAYSLSGQTELAAQQYTKVLELKPGLYEAELNLGILLQPEHPDQALPHLEAARKEKPNQFAPAFYLAEALAGLGKFPDSETHYAAAIAADPKSPHALAGFGRAQLRSGKPQEAAANFEKAAALDPQFGAALLDVADYYIENKNPEAAIAILAKLPESPKIRERMGTLLLNAGKYGEAVPYLEAAYRGAPSPALLVRLAEAYLRTQQTQKGLGALQQAVNAQPNDFDLRMTFGRALRNGGHIDMAAREYTRATEIKPDSQQAWSDLAGAQTALGERIMIEARKDSSNSKAHIAALQQAEPFYSAALRSLDRVKALGPENEGHLFFRALALDNLMQYPAALDSYRAFLEKAAGKFQDQEFQARQRVRIIQKILSKR